MVDLHHLFQSRTNAARPAPKYWAEVEYRDITTDGLLRHTTFCGLYASRAAKKPLVAKFKQERAATRASGSG
jgi:ATP-dependent DNA ligase